VNYVDICEEVAARRMTIEEATYILDRRERRAKILDRLALCGAVMAICIAAALVVGAIFG
jgi:hypothetical protein